MADFQWLVMAVVAIVAVIVTIYFGVRNLRNVITRQERDAGYASGRVDAKLESIEHKLGAVDAKLGSVERKLEAHDLTLTEVRGEAKKLGRSIRKLSRRVRALESRGTPPTGPHSAPTAVVTDLPSRRSA